MVQLECSVREGLEDIWANDPVSCWHLATSSRPHHRQSPPLPSNRGNIALHAVSNPVWTSPQCRHMLLPWLVEEACG